MKVQILIIMMGMIPFYGLSQFQDKPINQKQGSCYAKCLIENKYDEREIQLPIYIGSNEEEMKFEEILIQVREESIKEANQRNSFFDQNLSLGKYDTIQIVDTLLTEEYVLESFTEKILKEKGGYDWKEVLCGNKVDDQIIQEIQEKLFNLGYDKCEFIGHLDVKTKAELVKFQKENELPIGQLDLETLKKLEIDI